LGFCFGPVLFFPFIEAAAIVPQVAAKADWAVNSNAIEKTAKVSFLKIIIIPLTKNYMVRFNLQTPRPVISLMLGLDATAKPFKVCIFGFGGGFWCGNNIEYPF